LQQSFALCEFLWRVEKKGGKRLHFASLFDIITFRILFFRRYKNENR